VVARAGGGSDLVKGRARVVSPWSTREAIIPQRAIPRRRASPFHAPSGESGTLPRGSQGFDAEELVTCTYIGAESGNDYTVVGFYPEK
jgi:hypothetical protein